MKLAKPIIASAVIVAAMAAASAWALSRLPDAAIPAHWDIDGRPDHYMAPAAVLFFMPALTALLSAMFAVLPAVMPPQGDLGRSRQPYVAAWFATLGLMVLVHGAIIATAMGAPVEPGRIIPAGVGLLFVVLGNYLPKTRYNYVMGIRTPWTLADERVWDRTHRFAGAAFVLAGLSIVAGVVLIPPIRLLVAAVLVPTLAAVLASVIYSALVSRRVGGAGSKRAKP